MAVTGYDSDGHDYIQEAIQRGAAAILLENVNKIRDIVLPEDVTFIVTTNTRYALAIASCNFYKIHQEDLN